METSAFGGAGDVFRKNCTRSNLSFDSRDTNLKRSREAVPDDALHQCAAILPSRYDVGPHAFSEHPARPFFGQTKGDGGSFDGTSGLVRDLYSYRTAVLRSSRTDYSLALERSNMQK
jgi:hypothetical protein